MLLIPAVLLVGLQARWLWQTTILSFVLCGVGWRLFRDAKTSTDVLIQQFYQWAVYWLVLGLCFEPFQAGVHKDPSTYSYYFITTAIALFLLIVLTIWSDRFQDSSVLKLLIANGQNPMIAYVAFANLLWPLFILSGLEDWILAHTGTPILGVIKGIGYTLPIALLTSFFTQRKFFWRT
jgi:hydrogenase-4 membrane subunit HyfE